MDKKKMFKEFNKLVDSSIAINKMVREVYVEQSRSIRNQPAWYAQQFCTVDINIGRGVGKTQYIIDHAGHDDLVLVGQDRFKARFKEKNSDVTILSCHEVQNAIAHLTRFKNFWIDEPRMVFPKRQDLEEFYFRSASSEHEQTYIFLGTPV